MPILTAFNPAQKWTFISVGKFMLRMPTIQNIFLTPVAFEVCQCDDLPCYIRQITHRAVIDWFRKSKLSTSYLSSCFIETFSAPKIPTTIYIQLKIPLRTFCRMASLRINQTNQTFRNCKEIFLSYTISIFNGYMTNR